VTRADVVTTGVRTPTLVTVGETRPRGPQARPVNTARGPISASTETFAGPCPRHSPSLPTADAEADRQAGYSGGVRPESPDGLTIR